jgi:flagellar secretion chaperone FliS
MAPHGAQNQYLKTQVLTASKEQLVLMLFDGAIRFCERGKKGWADQNLEVSHRSLVRAQEIVLELAYALDKEKGGAVAAKMAQLYTYCYSRLVTANVERSPEIVDEVQHILGELRSAWSEAMEREGRAAGSANASAPSSAPAPAASDGKVLAKIPVKKMAVPAGEAGENRPRLSVQG